MVAADIIRLVSLAAIWGSSFIFMRIIVPSLGPVPTAFYRLLIAGCFLVVYCKFKKVPMKWAENWGKYLVIGAVSASLPFFLYAFAALHLPAGYSAILNSTTPLFGAVFSAIWLNEKFTSKKALGMFLGIFGVGLITGIDIVKSFDPLFVLSVAACLVATVCYGLSGIIVKLNASHLPSVAISAGSTMMASVVLLPAMFFVNQPEGISSQVLAGLLALALMCSAVAYLLYYRLLANVGPTKSYTVTFVIPIFGMIWAYLFLGEPITPQMILGGVFIGIGTRFVIKK